MRYLIFLLYCIYPFMLNCIASVTEIARFSPFTFTDGFWACFSDGEGDINGDGYNDIIIGGHPIGAPEHQIAFYIYLGGTQIHREPDYILIDNDFYIYGSQSYICYSSDVNGDGYDDIVISENDYDTFMGRCVVYFGGHDFDTNIDLIFTGMDYNVSLPSSMDFGFNVNTSGDFNGDGYNDIAISSLHSDGWNNFGQVNIFYGGPSLDTISDWSYVGSFFEQFGAGISSGDFNGDGISDLAVFSASYREYYDSQSVKVFYGGTVFNNSPDIVYNLNTDVWAALMYMNKDFNQDGFSDLFFLGTSLGIFWGSASSEMEYTSLNLYDLGFRFRGLIENDQIPYIIYRNQSDICYIARYTNTGLETVYQYNWPSDYYSYWYSSFLGDINNDDQNEFIISEVIEDSVSFHIMTMQNFPVKAIEHVSSPLKKIQTCPNPFKDQITISYEHKGVNPIEVSVFNIKGQKVYTLPNGLSFEKQLNVTWNGRDNHHQMVPNGIYFIQIKDSQQLVTKKILKIK